MNQREYARPLCRLIDWLLLLIFCTSLSGCALTNETNRVFQMAKRTTQVEPKYFEYIRSDRVAQREARLLAEQAWAEVGMPNSSPDYENGFLEGFADYLYRGGEGEPPVIPPRGYWNLRFLNQFGKASVGDWYEGFRQGAQDCKSRGLRDMWVVPTSLIAEPEKPSAPSNWEDEETWQEKNYRQEKKPLERLRNPESPPIPDDDMGDESDDMRDDMDDSGEGSGDFDGGGLGGNSGGAGSDEDSPNPDDDAMIEKSDPFGDERMEDNGNQNQLGFRDASSPDDATDGDGPADNNGGDGFSDPFGDLPESNSIDDSPDDGGGLFNESDLFPEADPTDGGLNDAPSDANPFSRRDSNGNGRNQANYNDRNVRQTSAYQNNTPRRSSNSRVNTLRGQFAAAAQRNQQSQRTRTQATNERSSNQTRQRQTGETQTSDSRRNLPRSSAKDKPFYSHELMIMDSVPPLPLEIKPASARTSTKDIPDEMIVWDPMEGVDQPPEFDVNEFDALASDQAIDDSTKWTPAMTRATELPPRIADRRSNIAPKTRSLQVIERPQFVAPNSSNVQLRDQLRMALDSTNQTRSNQTRSNQGGQLPPVVDRNDRESMRGDGNAVRFRINDAE